MNRRHTPRAILDKAKTIRGKRSRIVVEHILKYGHVTTEDLEKRGYKHPPRAIRDVREQGLPLEMFWTTNSDGRKIAGYRFGNPKNIRHDRTGGRKVFPKGFQREVVETYHSRCAVCQAVLEPRYLQIDHRVPYEVAGDVDPDKRHLADYMPLCGSCNRAKSWSCEHCDNWTKHRNPRVCQTCYWANPVCFKHVAMQEIRRLDIAWQGQEVQDYEGIANQAHKRNQNLPTFVKQVLRSTLSKRPDHS